MSNTKPILQQAHEIIHNDREQTHGDPSKNTKTIAAYWSIHLSHKYGHEIKLDSDDVCQMMIHLKMARLGSNPTHQDSLLDIAGYVGLQDRINSGT